MGGREGGREGRGMGGKEGGTEERREGGRAAIIRTPRQVLWRCTGS